MYEDEESASAILNRAIDLGITYLDTAYAYGEQRHEDETRVGKVMATRTARMSGSRLRRFPTVPADAFLRRLESAGLKRLATQIMSIWSTSMVLAKLTTLAKIE